MTELLNNSTEMTKKMGCYKIKDITDHLTFLSICEFALIIFLFMVYGYLFG